MQTSYLLLMSGECAELSDDRVSMRNEFFAAVIANA